MLHDHMLEHVRGAQCARSYDGLSEVLSGTKPTALYLDIEVDQLRAGEGGLLSVGQMLLIGGDARFWWRGFFVWYLDVAAQPCSREEQECTQELMVKWVRDSFAE